MSREHQIAYTIFSGSFAGACSTIAGAPFDTVKVRLQTNSGNFQSVRDCLWRTIREERVVSLYKGVTPALTAAVIENSVVFGANAVIKRVYCQVFTKSNTETASATALNLKDLAIIGGLSGIFSATAICPAEVVKCRLQAQITSSLPNQQLYKGSLDCVKSILKEEGMRGLFRGLPAQLARDVPFNFSFFGTYETVCHHMCRYKKLDSKDNLTSTDLMLAGGIAGIAGWTVTIPMDTVKSRVQVSNCQSPSRAQIFSTIRHIYTTHGVKGFFTGWTAAILRAFPANGALFVGYELSDRFIRNHIR